MAKPTPRKRGRAGQADRNRRLRLYPYCSQCSKEGKTKLTHHIDHIIPLHKGGPDTDDNCQGLCKRHHDEKTKIDMAREPKFVYGLDGWPVG